MTDEKTTEKRMDVTSRSAGYAHVQLYGDCSPDVTVDDIRKRFYHSYFGGRGEWVKDGKFGVIVHTD